MQTMNCVIVASLVAILFSRAETKLAIRRQRSTRSPCDAVIKRVNYDTATSKCILNQVSQLSTIPAYDGESVSVHARGGSIESTSCVDENSKCDGVIDSMWVILQTDCSVTKVHSAIHSARPSMVYVRQWLEYWLDQTFCGIRKW